MGVSVTREDSEGIRRVEQLLRQHADHEEAWRKRLGEDLENLRGEMREGFEKQDRRLSDVEDQMARRGGMAKAAGWLVATLVAVGATIGAFFRGWSL